MDNSELMYIENLSVWYKRDKYVLDNLSLSLNHNEVVGLIGLNGAGKTTFIKTLSGLMDSYNIGNAVFDGKAFSFRDRNFKRERYTVFAEDRSFQYFTFNEYISYAAKSYGVKPSGTAGLINGFNFGQYTDILLKELSTGNLKKAYLITAFAIKPKLLILDEPVNGLDFQSTEFLYQLINDYRQFGTLLFSSHILESICLTSDRVLVLEQGKIRNSFSGQEINSENIREALKE
ncbi:MAG: ABC transporter ATP-binding protein [Firmicutes bacterium]|nr:ABC transporter ATP-binding protein [Bacillota bacterium]